MKMKKKIIFQKCNIYNLYFLFHIIFACLNDFIEFYIFYEKVECNNNFNKDIKRSYYLPAQILNLYVQCLSDFLALIPFLIRKKLIRKNKQWIKPLKPDGEINNDNQPLIYNDNKISESQKNNKKIILLCFVVAVLDFLMKFSIILYQIIFSEKYLDIFSFSCLVPFEITLQFVFSYLILKIHFYKLQYLSLFVNLGIFVIILIFDIIEIIYFRIGSIGGYVLLFYAFNIIFGSLEFSFVKKILIDGFLSVYLLMLIKGVMVLIFVIIFSIILLFVKGGDIFTKILFFLKEVKFIFITIANIFCNFLEHLFAWLIIDKFSPNYYPFVLIFQDIGSAIIDAINEQNYKDNKAYNDYKEKRKWWDLTIRIVLYVISAICAILHNEIVVINICNLGSDTKYFLDLKLQSEEIYANTDDIDIIKEYETLGELGTERQD